MSDPKRPQNARRYGAILIVLGLLLGLGGSLLLVTMLPLLLHPGMEINGTTFNGDPGMAKLVILILGGVAVFGVTALGYGIFQVATGRRSLLAMGLMLAIFAGLYVIGWALLSR